MASFNGSRISLAKNLQQQSLLLDKKKEDLDRLIGACNQSVKDLQNDVSESLERIKFQKDEQISEITRKYDSLESELKGSTNKVIEELISFVENVMKTQKSRVERANELLKIALRNKREDDMASIGGDVMRIIKAALPDLHLSKVLKLKAKGNLYREAELVLDDSPHSPISAADNSVIRQPDCQGDCSELISESDLTVMSNTLAIADIVEGQSKSQQDTITPHHTQSHSSVTSQCPTVSFSKSIARARLPGFCSHVAQAGSNTFIVDSFAPAIYKVNEENQVKHFLSVESSLTVVGLAASVDYLYVQYMDITEYHRTVHVYTTKDSNLVKTWDTPNLLGASIALVGGHLVISSHDKVMVCTPTGKHIKDIAITPHCVKTICTLGSDSVVLCSTTSSLVMTLNLESEEVSWRNYAVKSPVCVAADTFGRVYALVQPSIIYVMDAKTGELLVEFTLSCPRGLMEGLCITNNGLLLATISYRGNNSNEAGCYSTLNTFRIEGVC